MPFLVQLFIGVLFMVLSALLTPKPKKPKPKDIETPTADAGRPMPVLFGSAQIKSPNCLYFGQAGHNERDANVPKKG